MSNDKRLMMLEAMAKSGQADSFARYALAMEYKGRGRVDDALATFVALRGADPGYVPMYLMCGTMLLEAGRGDDGRAWLREGITTARAKGDTHALSELESALAAAS